MKQFSLLLNLTFLFVSSLSASILTKPNSDIIIVQTSAGEDQTICGSQGAQLLVTGDGGYVWSVITGDPISVGSNFSCTLCPNPTASPNTTTTYLVTSNWGQPGSNTDTITIFVVPDYTTFISQSDTNICIGEDVNFNIGTNTFDSYNYYWNSSGAINDSSISNPTITFNEPGTNFISIDVVNSNGCIKSQPLYVNVAGSNITMTPDSITICSNTSSQLNISIDSRAPDSCKLSSSNACFSSSTQTFLGNGSTSLYPSATPYNAHFVEHRIQILYTASELNTLGFLSGKITEIAFNVLYQNCIIPYTGLTIKMGCTLTDSFPLIINQFEPDLIQVYHAASYQTIEGWNSHTLDNAYDWDGISNLLVEVCYDNIATVASDFIKQTLMPNRMTLIRSSFGSGTYGCTLSNPTAYFERPNIRITHCSGSPSPNTNNYSWIPSVGLSDSTIQNPIASPTNSTIYNLLVTDTLSGCIDSNFVVVDVELCTYIDELGEALEINIFPNPNSGNFTVTKPLGLKETVNLKLLSSDGKLILQKTILENQNSININISDYSKGIYFLHLNVGEQNFTRKIVRN
tara:strand:- start:255 stop:1973 length:1719 start_codon:yes stop_codon:yes gene_type:complete